jgi:hypothetical protein
MRVALVAVSIVAVLAVGALVAVVVTGWSISDGDPLVDEAEVGAVAVTDAQVTWCWTHQDRLVVAADALDIRNSSAGSRWGFWLSFSEVLPADLFDISGEGANDAFDNAREEFGAWLEGRGHEAVGDVFSWAEIVNEDEEFLRSCLAAWGAEFGLSVSASDRTL